MWPWRSRAQAAPRPTAFDAVVDLGPEIMGGLAPEPAMRAAEIAVRSVPGAAKVRIRQGSGPAPILVRVFPPGQAGESPGA